MEEKLLELINDYDHFFWTDKDVNMIQVQLGLSEEAHLIFSQNTQDSSCTVEITTYIDGETQTKASKTFSAEMSESDLIKQIIICIRGKLIANSFRDSQQIFIENLVNHTNNWITFNF